MAEIKFSIYDKDSAGYVPFPDLAEVDYLINKACLDAIDEEDPFITPETKQWSVSGDSLVDFNLTFEQILWICEVNSSWLPFNRLTRRYFAWKVNRKLNKFSAWLEH
jgi:hypothetical protein